MTAKIAHRTSHIAISVVMTTYNGIKYISEQLDSIRTQTLMPDEVIIADDVSSDGTYELCKEYIRRYGLEGWKVYRNEKNLGPAENFKNAIMQAQGKYIFTADQDDIWMTDKLESMVSVMEKRPEINLLLSNYIPVKDGEKLKAHLKYIDRNDGSVMRLKLKGAWFNPVRPGCTFCFRRELADKFKVMDAADSLHDSMLWNYAVITDSLYLLNRQLIYFRRHEGNATKVFNRTIPTIQDRINDIEREINYYRKFLDASEGLGINAQNQKLLEEHIKFFRKRKEVLSKRNLFMTGLFILMNFKHYPTTRNALSDIYAMIFLK